MDDIVTMAPPVPCLSICCTASWEHRIVPVTFFGIPSQRKLERFHGSYGLFGTYVDGDDSVNLVRVVINERTAGAYARCGHKAVDASEMILDIFECTF